MAKCVPHLPTKQFFGMENFQRSLAGIELISNKTLKNSKLFASFFYSLHVKIHDWSLNVWSDVTQIHELKNYACRSMKLVQCINRLLTAADRQHDALRRQHFCTLSPFVYIFLHNLPLSVHSKQNLSNISESARVLTTRLATGGSAVWINQWGEAGQCRLHTCHPHGFSKLVLVLQSPEEGTVDKVLVVQEEDHCGAHNNNDY